MINLLINPNPINLKKNENKKTDVKKPNSINQN